MEANYKPYPTSFLKYQVTLYSPPNRREGLTSARYSTQNFKSSEEPLKGTERKTHFRIGYTVKASLGTVSYVTQEAVCGAFLNKRKEKAGVGSRASFVLW